MGSTHEDEKKGATVVEYLRKVFGLTRDRFRKNPDHLAFFDSVADEKDATNWFKGMIKHIHVKAFDTATSRKETVAKQAAPVGTVHRPKLSKMLRCEGSPDSAKRNLVFQLNGVAVGRATEPSIASMDVLHWDFGLRCAVLQWAQVKTHKHKMVPIVAGSDRYLCIFNSFGVAFASGCFKNQFYDEDGMNFLFPELVNLNSNSNTAHSTITAWLRQMLVESTHRTYSEYLVEELPENVTAQCFRVGGISDLAAGGTCVRSLFFTTAGTMAKHFGNT